MNKFLPCLLPNWGRPLFSLLTCDRINLQTGEIVTQTPEILSTVVSIAHNLGQEIEIGPGIYLPRVMRDGWAGFYYCVKIDQEEAALLELTLTYPKGEPLTIEVIVVFVKETRSLEKGKRIAF